MKKLFIFVTAICLSALVWILLIRKGVNQENGSNSTNTTQKSPATSTLENDTAVHSSEVSGELTGKYPRWKGARSTGLNDPRWRVLNQREKIDPAWRGKVEIEFYGKVVDEKNLPIAGAMIKLSRGDLSPAGTTQVKVQSDVNGLFSLTGVVGRGLNVSVEKMGYYTSGLNRYSYEYAEFSDKNFHQPDPDNPVIFHLREKGQVETLVYRQTLYGLKIDGTPQYIDLALGRKITGGVPSGDISLSLVRSPSNNPSGYDWTLSLDGIGAAGFIESSEEFMFMAPETGYEKSIIIRQKAGASDYERQSRRNYYVRLADGRTYARVSTDVRPKYNDEGAIDITLYLNPSGSRNLEVDPQKTIRPKP